MRSDRAAVQRQFGTLFDEVTAILFRLDPIGINFGHNTDEYKSEVSTILPRMESATSEQDARRIIHEEFVKWFNARTAGPQERYASAAAEIWTAWQRFKAGG